MLAWFWMPEERIREYGEEIGADLRTWAAAGLLTLTPGNVTDYDWIERQITDLAETYEIQDIGYDPHNATQLVTRLAESHRIPCVEMRQGYWLSESIEETEARIMAGQVAHGGNRALTWCVSNARTQANDLNRVKLVRESPKAKIDGAIVLVQAIGRIMESETSQNSTRSVYEDRGLRTL